MARKELQRPATERLGEVGTEALLDALNDMIRGVGCEPAIARADGREGVAAEDVAGDVESCRGEAPVTSGRAS